MNKYQQLFIYTAAGALLFAASQSVRPTAESLRSASMQGNANTTVYKEPAAFRVEAKGEVLPFKFTGGDLRAAVLSHPLPKTWLVYRPSESRGWVAGPQGADGSVRVELPAEAEGVLRTQWELSLSAQYDWEMTDASDLEKRIQLTVAIINSSQHAARELAKILIDTPEGTRLLRPDEASELVRFTGAASYDLIKKAMEFK